MDDLLFGRTLDVPLDANGEQQARMLAARLGRETDLLIEASPRTRTQQTAKAIAATTHAELLTSVDIDELDFGRWSGQRFLSLAEDPQWRKWNERRDIAHTPSGDSIGRVQSRIARHLHRLQAAFPNRTIAVVTHAEVIRSALLWILQMPANAYNRLEISPASITALTWRDGEFQVRCVNERPYT
jgi:broad specificity phosphatase PhoE